MKNLTLVFFTILTTIFIPKANAFDRYDTYKLVTSVFTKVWDRQLPRVGVNDSKVKCTFDFNLDEDLEFTIFTEGLPRTESYVTLGYYGYDARDKYNLDFHNFDSFQITMKSPKLSALVKAEQVTEELVKITLVTENHFYGSFKKASCKVAGHIP